MAIGNPLLFFKYWRGLYCAMGGWLHMQVMFCERKEKQIEYKISFEEQPRPDEPGILWGNVSGKCKENVAALLREDSTLATADKEKADLLIKFFSSVYFAQIFLCLSTFISTAWTYTWICN